MSDRQFYWVKFGIGLVFVLVALQLVERVWGVVWAVSYSGEGYGFTTTPSEAVKAALKEVAEALVAVGFAVLVCGWAGIKYLIRTYLWQRNEPIVPSPEPGPDQKLDKLKELLRKLLKK